MWGLYVYKWVPVSPGGACRGGGLYGDKGPMVYPSGGLFGYKPQAGRVTMRLLFPTISVLQKLLAKPIGDWQERDAH